MHNFQPTPPIKLVRFVNYTVLIKADDESTYRNGVCENTHPIIYQQCSDERGRVIQVPVYQHC